MQNVIHQIESGQLHGQRSLPNAQRLTDTLYYLGGRVREGEKERGKEGKE